MEDPKVIYLGPACQKEGDGREWCEDDVWPQCECGCSSVRYVLESDAQSDLAALREAYKGYSSKLVVDALNAELAALREELAAIKTDLDKGDWKAEAIQRYSWLKEVSAQRDDLNQRLTAVEQRNALMSQFLKRMLDGHGMDRLAAWQSETDMVLTDACDKPTESGASE